jgi:hypothetical protein
MTQTQPHSPESAGKARDALISRLRALQQFTTARGCTEAEAAAAMAKVAELMAAHAISQTDVDLRRDAAACLQDEFIHLEGSRADWADVLMPMAKAYGTRVWRETRICDPLDLGHPMRVTVYKFFGLPQDVTACMAILAIIANSVEHESTQFRGKGRDARSSFRAGMVQTLVARLRAMERPIVESTGRGLIVLKDQLVTEEFAKLGLDLGPSRRTMRAAPGNGAAFAAGQSAGSRVNLGQGAMYGARQIAR